MSLAQDEGCELVLRRRGGVRHTSTVGRVRGFTVVAQSGAREGWVVLWAGKDVLSWRRTIFETGMHFGNNTFQESSTKQHRWKISLVLRLCFAVQSVNTPMRKKNVKTWQMLMANHCSNIVHEHCCSLVCMCICINCHL